ncbi:MAG: PilZ domain-containing protein [Gemmataceae bacterium]
MSIASVDCVNVYCVNVYDFRFDLAVLLNRLRDEFVVPQPANLASLTPGCFAPKWVVDSVALAAFHSTHHPPGEIDETLALLVHHPLLNSFHARHLREGHCHGFLLGDDRGLQPLGLGSVGVVYVAERRSDKKRMALKVLRTQSHCFASARERLGDGGNGSPEISEAVHAALCLGLDAKPERRPARCGELAALVRAQTPANVSRLTVVPEPEEPERRVARRFPIRIEATCTALHSDTGRWVAVVCDVSLTGVLLRTNRRYQPGSVLELQVCPDPSSEWSVFMVRVCWARAAHEDWNHGCWFGRPLTEGDLNLFLKNWSTTSFLGGPP